MIVDYDLVIERMNAYFLPGLLPDQHVNKSKPQRQEQSQSMHTYSNLSKILALIFPPDNAFWFLCTSNTCTCALFKMYSDDLKCVINAYSGLSLQLQEINAHCYQYIGCVLIEIERNFGVANDSENCNNNDPSIEINGNSNSNVTDANNRVTLSDSIADLLLSGIVTTITSRMVVTASTADSVVTIEATTVIIAIPQILEYVDSIVECEEDGLIQKLFYTCMDMTVCLSVIDCYDNIMN